MENWQRGGFGLYVHWPFCAAKCPYCDFNSHVVYHVDHDRWRQALLRDLNYWADRTPGRVLSSIFFGGGTPSLMPPDTIAAIIEAARSRWIPANDLEITLEANPTSADAARFAGYVDGGVNRFSVGLQALNDLDLKRLGRLHTVAEGRAAFDMARDLVDRVSFDLIYARQDQERAAWQSELATALTLSGEHLSLYQLTIEDGTAFGARHAAGRLRGLPGEDLSVDLWDVTQELTAAAGLERYETSNHAKPGAEARHNLIYWSGGDWVGIGPGAHGRLTLASERIATEAARAPQAWLERSLMMGHGTSSENVLQDTDISEEYLIMGLRKSAGIEIDTFEGFGGTFDPRGLGEMLEAGLLIQDNERLRTSEKGTLVLNSILGKIAAL